MNLLSAEQSYNAVANAVATTCLLCNAVQIRTKGEAMMAVDDALPLYTEFQRRMQTRLMPIKSQEELKEEVIKFISEIYEALERQQEEASKEN